METVNIQSISLKQIELAKDIIQRQLTDKETIEWLISVIDNETSKLKIADEQYDGGFNELNVGR